MKKSYLKLVIREIRQSFGRFAAIFAITLLGVGFLFGLISTTPMMYHSIDSYYNNNNFMDINIKSNLGFNEDDIEAIKNHNQVEDLMEAYSMDVLVEMGGEVLGGRIYGLPFDHQVHINKLKVLEGRLPQEANEIVVERESFYLVEASMGDKITISEENEDLDDIFTQMDFEIVGIVENPAYFQKQAEMTHVGNGRLGLIAYGPYEIYDMDVFTDVLITIRGSVDLVSFSDDYSDFKIKPIVEDLEDLGEERSQIRYDEIISEAREEIQEARVEAQEEIEQARIEAEEEIDQAMMEGQEEIDQARIEAEEEIERNRIQGENEINQAEIEAYDEINRNRIEADNRIERERSQAQAEIHQARSQAEEDLENSRIQAMEEIEENRLAAYEEIERNRVDTEAGIAEAQAAHAQLEAQIQAAQNEAQEQIDQGQRQIDREMEAAQAELDSQIQGARDELDREIQAANNQADLQIQEARAELDSGIQDARAQLASEIQDGYAELDSEIQEARQELEAEIQDAYAELEEEIQEAEEDLADIDEGQWFVLDRNTNASFVTFDLNSAKIDAVASVFPVFFYLVAALVSLTTMTRMVEEDRIQIGTLKALGYSKLTIILKYIIYSGLASFLGSLAGLIIGIYLLPIVIWNAFDSLFHLPEFVITFNWQVALVSSGIAIMGNILVTIYVSNHILRENAASLMQAKAPKAGKRILLERISFLWSRLSFNQKATIRNIFRYKKHFFMTVIGISGCMALLLTGFGLRDSIGDLANIQFDEIIGYNLAISFEDDSDDIYDVLDRDEIGDSLELHTDNGSIRYVTWTEDLSIIAVDDISDLDGFINLRDRKSGSKLDLDNDSAIITEKIPDFYDIQVPEHTGIENFDEDMGSVQLTHITENYVGNSIYMTKDKYSEVFNRTAENNTIYANVDDQASDNSKDEIINDLLSLDNVLSANLIADNRDTFDNLLANINYIVVVIIIASGGLAFIVLYNLTNININERKKELATFRVLGFYNEEVAGYIFRETAILTIIGILVGLGLGTILHRFVIITVEDPDFMFGRDIKLLSYGISALITMVFAFIVNIIMSKKIRDIKMADSMKAND